MRETDLVKDIQISVQDDPYIFLWRNNVGKAWQGEVKGLSKEKAIVIKNPRLITFGVGGEGASDLVGLRTVKVTNEMVGKWVAIFTSIECKSLKGNARVMQLRWEILMRSYGAFHLEARHRDDVLKMLENTRSS